MPADGFALPNPGTTSDAVRAAQEKLAELRRQHGIPHGGRQPDTKYEIRNTSEEDSYLDSRISFFSETLASHLRATAIRREKRQAAEDRDWLNKLRVTSCELRVQNESGTGSPKRITNEAGFTLSPLLPGTPARMTNDECRTTNGSVTPNSSLVTRHSSLIKVFPDIALGLLRNKVAAPGRVWLLLRHHDAAGRGRVATAAATHLLTAGGSPLRVCGRRQLANLLAAGDGLFWDRDTGRDGAEHLRLRSVARVAAGLGVDRLGGSPVAVPLTALTGHIGDVRAHLYASFHSGRTRADLLTGEKRARGPIARATLGKLSGAVPNSQRNYERRARVSRQSAIAIGPQIGTADEHETAWRRGQSLFHLHDRAGRYGRPGATYLAWQLPNEYTGPHATLPRGRMKRLNRALADLFHDGMTGNNERPGITNYELRITNEEASEGGRWAVKSGQRALAGGKDQVVRGLLSVARHRRYYHAAKVAFLAQHDRERYWRYGGAWLWQPEQVTSDERRTTSEEHRPPATGQPVKTSMDHSKLVTRHSQLVTSGNCLHP